MGCPHLEPSGNKGTNLLGASARRREDGDGQCVDISGVFFEDWRRLEADALEVASQHSQLARVYIRWRDGRQWDGVAGWNRVSVGCFAYADGPPAIRVFMVA